MQTNRQTDKITAALRELDKTQTLKLEETKTEKTKCRDTEKIKKQQTDNHIDTDNVDTDKRMWKNRDRQ